ncbi:hypothetical protein H6P81_020830 [Aristolochia fimbriata]|uniref:J domain-containing protein n=1 Tax=Aristolochia fimbriata TaxID=158543 RepID=A0AAV7DXA8_ARIFI|nr:hypothetical protein H6P81_020830 [Aristolochia fimbriata]
MSGGREEKEKNQWPRRTTQTDDDGVKLWGVFLFGLIGASITTLAVAQFHQTVRWFYTQLSRQQSVRGTSSSSYRSSFKEEAWKRYYRRMQEEKEEERERVERIRRMQNIFNRERNKYKRSYESWREYGPGAHHQHFQWEEWYWQNGSFHNDQGPNAYSRSTSKETGHYAMSHHYTVLGLDRFRATPYTDDEIKTAFRVKAKQHHPDQNPKNREAAEAKFKEMMASYEAIKLERKNHGA